eukprot:gb/GECG01012696.1/.p1 GENE.gb/GECG01012696.1/~~gb/GECG01012696.1/.p1  ORF type:complete len:120 (+),score=3.41 gb/GECG01012696.1/:1-360(+)
MACTQGPEEPLVSCRCSVDVPHDGDLVKTAPLTPPCQTASCPLSPKPLYTAAQPAEKVYINMLIKVAKQTGSSVLNYYNTACTNESSQAGRLQLTVSASQQRASERGDLVVPSWYWSVE